MKQATLFSFGLNVILVITLGLTRSSDTHPSSRSSSVNELGEVNHLTHTRESKPLRWEDLQAEDWQTMAKRLRAAGCSDQRVADLLVPEIERETRQVMTAVFLQLFSGRLSWGPPAPEWKALLDASGLSDIESIQERHHETMSVIFGPCGDEEERFEDSTSHRLDTYVDPLAEFGATMKEQILKLREERSRAYRDWRSQELEDGEKHRRLTVLHSEHMQTLRDQFPDEDVDDYRLRMSPFARLVRTAAGIELSRDELQEMVRLFQAETDATQALPKIEALIGSHRFAQFEPHAAKRLKHVSERERFRARLQ